MTHLNEELREEYQSILQQEETYWQQKNDLQWLSAGEQNSRYFHISVAARRHKKHITRLKDAHGNWISSPETLRELIRRHYQGLFSTSTSYTPLEFESQIPSFTHADRRWLNPPVSPMEIETAIFQMGAHKAPSPDGFPPVFFQTKLAYCWRISHEICSRCFSEWSLPSGAEYHSYHTYPEGGSTGNSIPISADRFDKCGGETNIKDYCKPTEIYHC